MIVMKLRYFAEYTVFVFLRIFTKYIKVAFQNNVDVNFVRVQCVNNVIISLQEVDGVPSIRLFVCLSSVYQ